MSGCTCESPTDFRATSENVDRSILYLRCDHCGGKAGTIEVSLEDIEERVTDPSKLDAEDPEVAEKVVNRGMPTVSIHFEKGDSPFLHLGE